MSYIRPKWQHQQCDFYEGGTNTVKYKTRTGGN